MVSSSILILIVGLKVLADVTIHIISSGVFSKRTADEADECGVETPEYENVIPKYDINAFKKRIENLKDDDGLYEIKPVHQPTDFTGAEIITNDYEREMDEYIGRG